MKEMEEDMRKIRAIEENRTGRRLGRHVAVGRPWTNDLVKYCFAPDLPTRTRKFFKLATKAWKLAMPCINFQDVGVESGNQREGGRCKQHPAIYVGDDGSGCNSYEGMIDFRMYNQKDQKM